MSKVGGRTHEDAQKQQQQQHPLSRTYCIWYRLRNQRTQRVDYKQGIKLYGKFSTVEEFWHMYSHMLRADELALVDINVFEEGIKPAWEDEANAEGGQWVVKLHKSFTAFCWEGLLLALIGNQIATSAEDAIHGLFLSIRYKENAITVWNRSAENRDDSKTVESLRRAMHLDSSFRFEYKPHGAATSKLPYNATSDTGSRVGFQRPRTMQPPSFSRGFAKRGQEKSSHFNSVSGPSARPSQWGASGSVSTARANVEGRRSFGVTQGPARSPALGSQHQTSSGSRFTSAFGQPQQQWEPMSPHSGRGFTAQPANTLQEPVQGGRGFSARGAPRGPTRSLSRGKTGPGSAGLNGGDVHQPSSTSQESVASQPYPKPVEKNRNNWRRTESNPKVAPTNSRWAS